MSFGWNGAPSNFAIFGDAISTIRAQFGMNNPSWRTALPFQSRLYVDDGMLLDIRNTVQQTANTDTWGWIARGLLGIWAINAEKLGMEGTWGAKHTLIGFDVDSNLLTSQLPEAKIDGVGGCLDNYNNFTHLGQSKC